MLRSALISLLSFGLLLLPAAGHPQCSPSGCSMPKPAQMSYWTESFHIPAIPLLSDGTGSKGKDSCEDLQKRLDRENGKGLTTNAVSEFFRQLDRHCARMDSQMELMEVTPEGDLCWHLIKVTHKGKRLPTPGEFCELYISHIRVLNESFVTVTFDDPHLPCVRRESLTPLGCEGPNGEYSPDQTREE